VNCTPQRAARRVALVFALALAGCSTVDLEPSPPYLAVRGRDLRGAWGPVRYVADHGYLTWRRTDDALPRVTERSRRGVRHAASRHLWSHEHETYALLTGDEALEAIARLERAIAEHPHFERYDEGYVAWPGPNSNSFLADACRRAAIPVDLPPDFVAKDWPGLIPWVFDAGISSTRSGVQLDLLSVVGLQLGLREGIELHLLGSALGIDLWPPALKLPFFGRLGLSEGGDVERTGDVWAWIDAHREDSDPLTRARVASAIGSALSEEWWSDTAASERLDLLLALLDDSAPRVRAAAATSLVRRAPFFSWERWPWHTDEEPLSGRALVERLLAVAHELSEHDTPGVRAQGVELLGALSGQPSDQLERVARTVLLARAQDSSARVRARVVEAAARLDVELE